MHVALTVGITADTEREAKLRGTEQVVDKLVAVEFDDHEHLWTDVVGTPSDADDRVWTVDVTVEVDDEDEPLLDKLDVESIEEVAVGP